MLRVIFSDNKEDLPSPAASELNRLLDGEFIDYTPLAPLGRVFDYPVELNARLEHLLNSDPCVESWEVY